MTPRLLAAPVRAPLPPSDGLVDEVERAGLTGRGGAGFPTARKLRAVAAAPGGAVVVANGAEGEPAAGKDAHLLRHDPHLVLDGLALAAAAVGASTMCASVPDGPVGDAVRRAAADRPVRVVTAPDRYLAGQESALVHALDGGPAVPRWRPQRVTERGIGGRPTLVQNVETLAHLALIARHGAGWFRAVGTRAEPGTALVTVHDGGPPRVLEVPLGTPLALLVPPGPVLLGGYGGAWLSAADAGAARLAEADLRPRGASLGAGVVAVLPPDRCGLVETARVARYLALQSAGQCGPCLNGLPRIAVALADVAAATASPAAVRDVLRWAGLVERRGACHHPDGAARFVRSALTVFGAELDRHLRGGCSAGSTAPFLPVPAEAPVGARR